MDVRNNPNHGQITPVHRGETSIPCLTQHKHIDENKNRRNDRIRQNLDMRPLLLAALRPPRRERQSRFLGVVDLCPVS